MRHVSFSCLVLFSHVDIVWFSYVFSNNIAFVQAVHPISNLLDLKRRLGVGRRCFGYLHPAIRG